MARIIPKRAHRLSASGGGARCSPVGISQCDEVPAVVPALILAGTSFRSATSCVVQPLSRRRVLGTMENRPERRILSLLDSIRRSCGIRGVWQIFAEWGQRFLVDSPNLNIPSSLWAE